MMGLIQTAPTAVFLFLCLLPAAFLGIGAFAVFTSLHKVILIKQTPAQPISAIKDGYACFEGKVAKIGTDSLRAPLTSSECCWFHYRVEQYVRSDNAGKHQWSCVAEKTSDRPFLINDGTRPCVVMPDGLDVTPTDRSIWYGDGPVPTEKNPPREKPDKRSYGSFNAVVLGKPLKAFRYTEERIYTGDTVFAMGAFSQDFVLVRAEPGIEVDYVEDELKFMAALPLKPCQQGNPSTRGFPFFSPVCPASRCSEFIIWQQSRQV